VSERPTEIELRALPAVAVQVLESLHQHRLLTARQVHAMHTPTALLRWTQHILTELRARGLADHAKGPRGLALWFLTSHGAATIQATSTHTEPRWRPTSPAQASGPLRAHTLAVNDTGIAFVKAARERDGDNCDPLSWRHEIAHPLTQGRSARKLIADALLTYLQAAPDQSLTLYQRFIELDRGTIPPEQLAAKLATYSQLRHHTPTTPNAATTGGPLWRAYYRTFPAVLVVLADQTPAHARRRIQRAIALYRTDPTQSRYGTVPISFVTLAQLTSRGPFAPIFISAEHPETYVNWLGDTHPTKR
jgi:hypothetical protein